MNKFKVFLMGFGVCVSIVGTAITTNAQSINGRIIPTISLEEFTEVMSSQTQPQSTTPTQESSLEDNTTTAPTVPESSESGTTVIIIQPTEEVTEEPTVYAKATQVLSGNNLENWKYQPLASEVEAIFASIRADGFDYVDTRYFDSGRAGNVVGNGVVGTVGYDLGLMDTKSGNVWSHSNATKNSIVSPELVAMAMYKAFGIYEYDYTVEYESISENDVIGGAGNLLITIGKPYNALDLSKGKVIAYISNSETSKYKERYNEEFGSLPADTSAKSCLKVMYKMVKQLGGTILSDDALDELIRSKVVETDETDYEMRRIYAYYTYLGYIKDSEWKASSLKFSRFLEILNCLLNATSNDLQTSKVTIVKSVNNFISGEYFVPKFEDIPNLEYLVQKSGPFAVVYSGQFDIRGADTVDTSKIEDTSRALEILGYDLLLKDESFTRPPAVKGELPSGDSIVKMNTEWVDDKGIKHVPYVASVLGMSDKITQKVAIMDIYKALGMSQYDTVIWSKECSVETLQNSPAILNLPGYIDTVDASKGYTYVWTTRTHSKLYTDKAVADLKIDNASLDNEMTSGEFIVLLAEMMEFYGEPVISESEVNQLLQVLGDNIPMYLSVEEADAWVYLKVRGCLNDDTIKFYEPITLSQMLDILVCVADTDSRTTYKEVELTVDIGELANEGYFPKTVTIFTGDKALYTETEVEYSESQYYDYFIEVTNKTKFTTVFGAEVKSLSVKKSADSEQSMTNTVYLGKELINDKYYYHFTVPKDIDLSKYGGKDTVAGCIKISPKTKLTSPIALWLPVGGGVYTYNESTGSKAFAEGLLLSRNSFTSYKGDDFKLYVDKERMSRVSVGSLFKSFVQKLIPNEAEAAGVTGLLGAGCRVLINPGGTVNAKSTAENLSNIVKNGVDYTVSKDQSFAIEFSSDDYNNALASIEQDLSQGTTFHAISTIYGIDSSVMINYEDLVKNEILYNPNPGELPMPVDGVLTVYSNSGVVRLNNNTKEVVSGNTIYKIPSDTDVYKIVQDAKSKTLWIDFRAIYGWANNKCTITATSTGKSWGINVSYKSEQDVSTSKRVNELIVNAPESFRTSYTNYTETLKYLNRASSQDLLQMLSTTGYSLANWVIYEDGTDIGRDYCIVFYPSAAFNGQTGNVGNSGLDLESITGCNVMNDDWCYKVYELKREASTEYGRFSYSQDQGYLYNVPNWEDFSIERYLNGTYILPISYDKDSGKFINSNVNAYWGCTYGTRPYTTDESNTKVIDIKGVVQEGYDNSKGIGITATPVGSVSFMAGGSPLYYRASSPVFANSGSTAVTSSSTQVYFGTSPVESPVSKNGETYVQIEHVYQGIISDYKIVLSSSSAFYNVNTWRCGDVIKNVYVGFNGVVTSNAAVQDTVVEQIGDGAEDEWDGFEELSIQSILRKIDSTTSFVIIFTIKILPMLAIILLTILVGFSIMADNKLIRLFCEKIFDPVYWITLGSVHVGELNIVKHAFGLTLGYLSFIMIYNGNLLRVIAIGITWYQEIVKYFH